MWKWIKKKLDRIYLWASDCDGMCNHCTDPVLYRICKEHKQGKP